MSERADYIKHKVASLTWGQRGTCEFCDRETTSGTLVRIGFIPGEGVETVLQCYLCVKKDIGLAWDTEYDYYA